MLTDYNQALRERQEALTAIQMAVTIAERDAAKRRYTLACGKLQELKIVMKRREKNDRISQ
jgi:hypothetical protein